MTRYAVLLRAVNVGGHNKVPMARLREISERLGYSDVATYVQSGNLVVTASPKAAAVEQAVAKALRAELDVDVDVIARTLPELQAVMTANPFPHGVQEPTKLHVSFLTGAPTAPGVADLDGEKFGRERFALGDRCLYLWYADGAGRSKMGAAPWERWLGVRGTARNWLTLQTLVEMLAG